METLAAFGDGPVWILWLTGAVILVMVCGGAWAYWDDSTKSTRQDADREAEGRVVARWGRVWLYDEPPMLSIPYSDDYENCVRYPITPGVDAEVQTAGNVSVTRKRSITGGVVGGIVAGPVGMVAGGGARDRFNDARELYVSVEGPDWQEVLPGPATDGEAARRFAQEINLLSRRLGKVQISQPVESSTLLDDLERLKALRDDGVLTEAQFEAERDRLVDRQTGA